MDNNSLLMLGIGAATGVCGIFLLIEMWPLIALGGAGYLICRGMEAEQDQETKR